MTELKKAVVVDGYRTPFLKAGSVPNLNAVKMAMPPLKKLLELYPKLSSEIDLVIGANVGNQLLHPDGSNLARVILLNAGMHVRIPAWTVNINCASGLHAVLDAVKQIETGFARCVLVVAVEVMSDYTGAYARNQREYFAKLLEISREKRWWKKYPKLLWQLAKIKMMPHKPAWMIELGLTDPTCKLRMDETAEIIAKDLKISREEQDLYAWESQHRAAAAQKNDRFSSEIVPIDGIKDDNGIRPNQTLQQLAKLKPLRPNGTVTAGNSSQISDGAVAILLAEKELAEKLGWPALANMSSQKSAVMGGEPDRMGLGPVRAVIELHNKTKFNLDDFDVIETNEAFASVVLGQRHFLEGLDAEKTNVNGGAIALGHPISATGARLVLTCARELALRNARRGLVTLCVGGGQGVAAAIERGGNE